MEQRYEVRRERSYKPYMNLMAAADHAIEEAESERPGYFFDQMTAILMASLSIEAIGNSFGDALFQDWKDFESSRPLAKIRLIAERLNVEYDIKMEPWATLPWLIKIRNDFAHSKPKLLVEETILTKTEREKRRLQGPQSKLEKTVTIQAAKRALRAVEEILMLFANALPEDKQYEFLTDSWSGSASPIINQQKS